MVEEGSFLYAEDTIDQMYDAWYPKYTDWKRTPEKCPDGDYEYVIRNLNAEWKRRIAEAPECMLDQGAAEALDDYVKEHSR